MIPSRLLLRASPALSLLLCEICSYFPLSFYVIRGAALRVGLLFSVCVNIRALSAARITPAAGENCRDDRKKENEKGIDHAYLPRLAASLSRQATYSCGFHASLAYFIARIFRACYRVKPNKIAGSARLALPAFR